VACFFLAVYNLDTYPSIWLDEGIYLQPPRNLVVYGEYAVRENGQLRRFDSFVGTGPPVLLPVAFAFRVIGMGLWQARFVTVVYLLLAASALYKLTRQLYGSNVGLLGLGLIVASPGLGFIPLGRQVIGEVPSFFFFVLGTLAWVNATRQPPLLVLSGLAFGLAMITKNIYAVILPAGWLVLWIADRRHYRQLGFTQFLLPLLISFTCLATWYGYQIASLGFSAFQQGISEMGASAGRSIVVFPSQQIPANLKYLLGPNFYLALGVPGLIYNAHLTIRGTRSLPELQRAFLLMTSVVWLIWYIFASIGWSRYALPALMLTAVFVAKMILDLGSILVHFLQSKTGEQRSAVARVVRGSGLVAIIGLLWFFPFFRTSLHEETEAMLNGNDNAARRFAEYLTAHIAPDARIESWEWPIDFFSDQTFHHPPPAILDAMIRHMYLGEPYSYDMYDFEKYHPDYLINGPFSKWTGIYPPDYLAQECTLIVSIGAYDLFRVDK